MSRVGHVEVSPSELLRDHERVFASLASAGGLVWVRCGNHRFLVVNDADHVKHLLIDRSDVLVKPGRQVLEAGGTPKPINANVSEHELARFRAAMARGLGQPRIPLALDAFAQAAAVRLAVWHEGAELPLMQTVRHFAVDWAARTSFGTVLGDDEVERTATAIAWADLTTRITSKAVRTREVVKAQAWRRHLAARRLASIGGTLIARGDLGTSSQLTAVVHDLPRSSRGVTHRTQAALVGSLMQGMVAPLTQALSWALLCSINEHERTHRLREEWDVVLAPGALVDLSTLTRLRYTEAFVREVTRLHPTNSFMIRVARQETDLGGEAVHPDCRVVINVPALHSDHRYFDQPGLFLPERWLDGRASSHKFAYLGFGIGSRRCLGENLAIVAMVALLPRLVRGLQLELRNFSLVQMARMQPSERVQVALRNYS